MVLSDRQSTIGVKDNVTSTTDEPQADGDNDDETPSLMVQNMNRRWITSLRLYCAIDGSLPLLATGAWASIVTHYRRKVSNTTTAPKNMSNHIPLVYLQLNSTPPDKLLTADDSDNEAAGTAKGSNSHGDAADDLAAEDEKNTAETERMLSNITDDRKRRRLSSIMIASNEDDEGF